MVCIGKNNAIGSKKTPISPCHMCTVCMLCQDAPPGPIPPPLHECIWWSSALCSCKFLQTAFIFNPRVVTMPGNNKRCWQQGKLSMHFCKYVHGNCYPWVAPNVHKSKGKNCASGGKHCMPVLMVLIYCKTNASVRHCDDYLAHCARI
jgi:hypothetical protein